ncbi:hypothetical protein [Shewanella maritima]|uniref:hypothetical protein n=1 Tax=Shewanella maritima TaxID=2520507 RepID=UPI003734EF6C
MPSLEQIYRKLMLVIGAAGVLVNYSGFLYLFFSDRSTAALPWFLLVSPWICIFFGLTKVQQVAVLHWFAQKFRLPNAK